MTGKEILLKTLRCESTERVPWVPFVGVHGGSLVQVDATTYLRSVDHVVDALKVAHKRYQPDGLPVVFDLQLEAEVLGCELVWAKETPPSVSSHPLAEECDLSRLPKFSTEAGRIPMALEATRRLRNDLGDDVALYGLLTGPLTLGLHLRGDEFLMDIFDEEDSALELLDFGADVACKMVDAYLDAGIDVVAVVDPMISQVGPEHFQQFVAEPLNKVFDHIRARGALSSLFVCGNATRNLEPMCATRCDNISVDENVNLKQLAELARPAGKSFGGNLQLTVVLLLGDPMDAQRDAVRCLDQAGEGPGFVLAPGCDLPFSVRLENLEAIAPLVRDPYQLEIARALPENLNEVGVEVDLPDYEDSSAVIVDVVTLDSAGCAPCTYMVKAAQEAVKAFAQPAQVREHKITTREGLGYMKALSVSAIPSICIDGKECFASIIPDRYELVKALQQAASVKS